MKLNGKLIQGTKILKEATVESKPHEKENSFRETLEECLISVCKELDIQVPIWLKKNTTEFVNYGRTSFTEEQFIEKVNFQRLEIKYIR
ncbi:MAG TPA: hypothetical protein GXX20_06935 [Clostridiaceae bacterium]|nr:hypothetical protein [Clostridiaceae bacterium]